MAYYGKDDKVLAQVEGPYKPRRGVWMVGIVLACDFSRTGSSYPYQVRLDKTHSGQREWYFSSRCIVLDTPRNRRTRRVQSQ